MKRSRVVRDPRLLVLLLLILSCSMGQTQTPSINPNCSVTPTIVMAQMNSDLSWDPPGNNYNVKFKGRSPFGSSAAVPIPAAQPHRVKGDWICNSVTVHGPSSLKICDFTYTPTTKGDGGACPDPIVRVIPPLDNNFYYWFIAFLALLTFGTYKIFERN
jgi:hypothetical protein